MEKIIGIWNLQEKLEKDILDGRSVHFFPADAYLYQADATWRVSQALHISWKNWKSDAFSHLNGMSKYYLSLIENKKLYMPWRNREVCSAKFQICVENYLIHCGIFSILLCPWHVISQWQFECLNFFQLLKTEIYQSFFWPISVHTAWMSIWMTKRKLFLLMHSRHARNLYDPKMKIIFEIMRADFEKILSIHFYPHR